MTRFTIKISIIAIAQIDRHTHTHPNKHSSHVVDVRRASVARGGSSRANEIAIRAVPIPRIVTSREGPEGIVHRQPRYAIGIRSPNFAGGWERRQRPLRIGGIRRRVPSSSYVVVRSVVVVVVVVGRRRGRSDLPGNQDDHPRGISRGGGGRTFGRALGGHARIVDGAEEIGRRRFGLRRRTRDDDDDDEGGDRGGTGGGRRRRMRR